MTRLTIYPDNDPHQGTTKTKFKDIVDTLADIGVLLEKWEAGIPLSRDASNEEVLAAYEKSVSELNTQYDFKTVDVIGLHPDHPDREAMRNKFLAEHTHADFEIRFFVEGSGIFYLHVDNKVYATLCEQGDLISVPANTTHWFDMGTAPYFKCIRFFTTDDGWVGNFTGSDIATRFPDFDTLTAT